MKIIEKYRKGAKVEGSEHSQALLRVAAMLFISLISLEFLTLETQVSLPLFLLVETVLSALLFAHVLFFPTPNRIRKIASVIFDQVMITYMLNQTGVNGALYFFLFTFVTVGNGFRFGERYLILSGAFGTAGILYLMFGSAQWVGHSHIAYGLLASHIMLTGYTGFLLNRLRGIQGEASKSHYMLQAIIDASPAVIFVKSAEGKIQLVNRKYRESLKLNSEQIIGKTDRDLFPQEIADTWGELDRRVVITGQDFQAEEVAPTETGMHTYLSVKFPIRAEDGRVVSIGGIATDVTELKRAETERAELQVREKTAIEASNMKSSFLATMSHELRTPINGVMGTAELLRLTHMTEEQKLFTEIISQSADTLLVLVNDILDLSKAEAGKLEVENVDVELNKIITQVEGPLKLLAQRKGLALSTHVDSHLPRMLKTDPTRLRQVLMNLINNAIKFTSVGSVTVAVRNAQIEGRDRVLFEIDDTGIGIPDEVLPRLFTAFSQADASTTRKFGGSGLGLSICKHLVSLLGGEIGVDKRVGGGTRFWFSIPLEVPKTVAQPVQVALPPPTKRHLNVLLAEDNSTNQMIAIRLLQSLGCTVRAVKSGLQAVRAVQDAHYDLIFMDCQMPEMDGFEATRSIRAEINPLLNSIPIIALTANAMSGDREKCLAAGMDDYVSKPFRAADLQAAIERVLAAKSKAA